MTKMVAMFSKGLEFASTRDAYELDYGLVETPFGNVSRPIFSNSLRAICPISGFWLCAVQLFRKGMFWLMFSIPCVSLSVCEMCAHSWPCRRRSWRRISPPFWRTSNLVVLNRLELSLLAATYFLHHLPNASSSARILTWRLRKQLNLRLRPHLRTRIATPKKKKAIPEIKPELLSSNRKPQVVLEFVVFFFFRI